MSFIGRWRCALIILLSALTASCGNGGGSTSQAVGGGPFTVSPQAVTLAFGATQAFTADTPDAVDWSIEESAGGSIGTSGGYTAPASVGTFHVRATDKADTTKFARATVTVTAAATGPTINSFIATPASISNGDGATLTWATSNTATLSIDNGIGVVSGTSMQVSPATTTTYHLTATGASGISVSAATTVVVNSATIVVVKIDQGDSTLGVQQSAHFTATVTGTTNKAVTWSVDKGSVDANGQLTAPAVPGTLTLTATSVADATKSASITVTVSAGVSGSVSHPRIWLTADNLAALRTRAGASDASWVKLRQTCDALVARPIAYPDGSGGGSNAISGGYQYFDYLDYSITLGLCYQVAKGVDSAREATYGAKAKALLLAITDPVHRGTESTDSGWAIRGIVQGMAILYDWTYELLSQSERAQAYNEMNTWIVWFDKKGFGNDHPQGNYFAGYYSAKALAALATEGDNPSAAAMWSDWLNRMHYQMVQPYYEKWLAGGGWPEGWNYGPNGVLNMLRPLVAAKTAKGLDLMHDAQHPVSFPDGHAKWMTHFSWPDRLTVSSRGRVYEGPDPTPLEARWVTEFGGLLKAAGGVNAALFQSFAKEVRGTQSATGSPWAELLFWDANAASTNYQLALSYRTGADGQVAMRSSWAPGAVWAAFQAGPFTNNPDSSEEYFDEGSIAIQRGGVPFVVNTTGELVRYSPKTTDSRVCQLTSGGANTGLCETSIENENFGVQIDGIEKARRIYNVFMAVRPGGSYWGQFQTEAPTGAASLSRYDEGESWVVLRGSKLETLYLAPASLPAHPIKGWTRDIVYLRPNLFVVHDRTSVSPASSDHWVGWHVMRTPKESAGATGAHQFDVVDASQSNLFRGRLTTVLPQGGVASLVNVFNSSKVYRIEMRTATPNANDTWLTVLDAADSASAAYVAAPFTATSGGVLGGAMEGTYLVNTATNSRFIVLFSTTGQQIAGAVKLAVESSAMQVLLTDMAPSTGYSVSVESTGNGQTVTVTPGGTDATSSPSGTLTFKLTSAPL